MREFKEAVTGNEPPEAKELNSTPVTQQASTTEAPSQPKSENA